MLQLSGGAPKILGNRNRSQLAYLSLQRGGWLLVQRHQDKCLLKSAAEGCECVLRPFPETSHA